MKISPYSLYIEFEALQTLWKTNGDRAEGLFKCGFIAIELSCRLLGHTLKGERLENNKAEMVQFLLIDIEKQLDLLLKLNVKESLNEYSIAVHSFKSENISHLGSVCSQFEHNISSITAKYFSLCKLFKLDIGLSNQINSIREQFELPKIEHRYDRSLDYATLIKSKTIEGLKSKVTFNSEDETFVTIHQITECWWQAAINELQLSLKAFDLQKSNLDEAPLFINNTCEIINFTSHHILLLEMMVLADYHELRLALRGASGGQSEQAKVMFGLAHGAFNLFKAHLQQQEVTIFEVLEQPRKHPQFAKIINCMSVLERVLQHFLFQHYKLSASVIGSKSFGSIGKDLSELAKRFSTPMFKEIDAAKYDLTMKTNFQHANGAGQLILQKENFKHAQEQNYLVPPALTLKTIQAYFKHISNRNKEAWISLFKDKEGYIEDPVGSRPYLGNDQLGVFFKGVKRMFASITMQIEHVDYTRNGASVKWSAHAKTYHHTPVNFKGVEHFILDVTGEIIAAKVEWDPQQVSDQV